MRAAGFLLFMLLQAVIVTAQITLTRGPYLQTGTPHSMIIRWKTNTPSVGTVQYGIDKNTLSQSVSPGIVTSDHEVKIEGLQPYTKYYYAVYANSIALTTVGDSTYYFITSPEPGTVQPIHVWVIGDFGRNNAEQKGVRDSYWNGMKAGRHTDVWLWLGDNAYGSGTEAEFQSNVFNVYPHILRNTVTWPCPGNHDYKSVSLATHDGPYYRIFSLPENGEAGGIASGHEGFYAFDYGNVHFVSLNSEWALWTFPSDNEQIQWLRNDLAATTQTWKIVYWHKPPYSKGSHDSDAATDMSAMRANIVPVIEQYGVDLVLCGHSHNYERSFLLSGHTGVSSAFDPSTHILDASCGNPSQGEQYIKYMDGDNPNSGTVYCVVGNSGSGTSGKPLNHPAHCVAFQDEYGSLTIDINGNELHAKYFTKEGVIKDEFKIVKQSRQMSVADHNSFVKVFNVFPNPFNREMQIVLQLKKEEHITVEVLDYTGKVIAALLNNQRKAGILQFRWQPDQVARGNYVVRVTNGEQIIVKSVTLQ